MHFPPPPYLLNPIPTKGVDYIYQITRFSPLYFQNFCWLWLLQSIVTFKPKCICVWRSDLGSISLDGLLLAHEIHTACRVKIVFAHYFIFSNKGRFFSEGAGKIFQFFKMPFIWTRDNNKILLVLWINPVIEWISSLKDMTQK